VARPRCLARLPPLGRLGPVSERQLAGNRGRHRASSHRLRPPAARRFCPRCALGRMSTSRGAAWLLGLLLTLPVRTRGAADGAGAAGGCHQHLPQQQRGFGFDDMFDSRYSPKYLSGAHWLSRNDGSVADAGDKLAMTEEGAILLYDPSTDSSRVLASAEQYASLNASSFKVSSPGHQGDDDDYQILVASNSVAVYRHSRLSSYRVFSVATGTWVGIDESRPQQTAIWGMEGVVAFVREHNVYLYDSATGVTTQVTSDGTHDGVIRNGIPDWVYEEEVLGAAGALYFSGSGRQLAYLRFDDTNVPQFNYTYWGNVYPDTIHLRYPKPGFDNPRVSLKIYDLDSQNTVTMELDGDEMEASYYVCTSQTDRRRRPHHASWMYPLRTHNIVWRRCLCACVRPRLTAAAPITPAGCIPSALII
jgi:hypothetical protein